MRHINKILRSPFLPNGTIVHFCEDDYGRVLVIDIGKQRVLSFDSPFEQSCMHLSHPYQLIHKYTQFMAIATTFVDPEHITMLGLGGGSLLRSLHFALPKCTFHVIELRQAVVRIADEYFSVPRDHRVRISINDALEQIAEAHSNSSDIIFSDMYNAYRMAPDQIKKCFLLECARVLTDQGFLVINLHSLPDDQLAFFEILNSIFSTVLISSANNNVVLFASKAHPEQVESSSFRMDNLEQQLNQRLVHLLARLTPINVNFSQ